VNKIPPNFDTLFATLYRSFGSLKGSLHDAFMGCLAARGNVNLYPVMVSLLK